MKGISLVPVFFAIVIPVIAYLKNALTITAAIEAAFMILLASTMDIRCMWILIIAFAMISAIDRCYKEKIRYVDLNITLKTGPRDWLQVFVNGGVASISAIMWLVFNKQLFIYCYVAAIAEALADSTSSSVGVAFGGKVYNICTRKEMQVGLSGGVSLAGTIGAMIMCTLLCSISLAMRLSSIIETIVIIFSGFSGCIVDSILGASLQRKNKCQKCGIVTEKKFHCGIQTDYFSGLSFLNNDLVNLISNFFSAACAAVLLGVIR